MNIQEGKEAIINAKNEILEVCYDYVTNFMGCHKYDDFLEFLVKETEYRSFIMYYFIDKLAKDPTNIQELAELCYFASDVIETPILLQKYFTETVEILLKIPQFETLHEQIRLINNNLFKLLTKHKPEFGNVPDIEAFFEGTLVRP